MKIYILSVFVILFVPSQGKTRRTKYGCEGSTLDILCEENRVIKMVRANFGRFSISICNEEGITDWSVNCMEPRTLRTINQLCDGKQSCSLSVDSQQFGDPCPGTHKYVEVHYTCESKESLEASTKAPQQIPPWLLDLAVTRPSTTTESSTTTSVTSTPSTTTSTLTSSSTPSTTENKIITTTTKEDITTQPIHLESFPEEILTPDYFFTEMNVHQHCSPIRERKLFWNWTRGGQEAIQMCPNGSNGFAKWKCELNGSWSSSHANLGECQSHWIARMESRLKEGGSSSTLSSELASVSSVKSLYGGDILSISKLFRGFASRLRQELYIIGDQGTKESLVTNLFQNVLKTFSNLVSEIQTSAWNDVSHKRRINIANDLISSLEENALLLAETIDNEKNIEEKTEFISSGIRVLRARDASDQSFGNESAILVPSSILLDNSANGASRLILFLYDKFILPLGFQNKFLNSQIIGALLTKERKDVKVSVPLLLTFKHFLSENVKNPSCVSWNSLEWTSESCFLLASNLTHSLCECSSLSIYALMMEDSLSSDFKVSENDSYTGTLIACLIAIVICLGVILLGLAGIRHFELINSSSSSSSCFNSKKTPDFYPSSNQTSGSSTTQTLSNISSASSPTYLQHILSLQGVSGGGGSGNGGSGHRSSLGSFRPISPYGHIYMEIDPVYIPDSSETSIQLSDLSDDDLMRKGGSSDVSRQSNSSSHHYGEERPLIKCGPSTILQISGRALKSSDLRNARLLSRPQVYPYNSTVSHQHSPHFLNKAPVQGQNSFVSLAIIDSLRSASEQRLSSPSNGLIFSDI